MGKLSYLNSVALTVLALSIAFRVDAGQTCKQWMRNKVRVDGMTNRPCVQDVAFVEGDDDHIGRLCLQLNCHSDCVQVLRSIVMVMCARAEMCSLQTNRVALAVDELFANIAEHAYGGKPGKVAFECRLINSDQQPELCFEFRDYASHGWQGSVADLPATLAVDSEICPGGLGLSLIQAVADSCKHEVLDDGNVWTLSFKRYVGDNNECKA